MSVDSSNCAVFLSYASQDADAALRLCKGLRAMGIEVWFDKNELTGGDAWDAKIRKQIAACSLFVPIISAATQARREGYFRLEWRIAVQRTYMMSEQVAFLLPVVIDAIDEREADVPQEFRAVQWTRLQGGETSAAFCTRVKTLLEGRATAAEPGRDRVAAPGRAPAARASTANRSLWLTLASLACATGVLAVWQPWKRAVAGSSNAQAISEGNAAVPATRDSAPVPAQSQEKVAVLAFADESPAHDSEYFSDGISEELINALGKVPGLKVPARTSSFYFKGRSVPLPEIARQLGVAYVIEGSVQRAGDKVKIRASLTKAADGFQVWTDSFTREAKDVFAVEEEIAGLIAKNLSLKLGTSSSASTASVLPQAFELYVQARQAWNLRTAGAYDRAEQLLDQAIALQPDFGRAHAALADVWSLRGQSTDETTAWGARASEANRRILEKCRQAIALDPACAEAHASFGAACFNTWRISEAREELKEAVRLNPSYATAHQWLGRVYLAEGEMDAALEHLRIATELDPLSPRILDNYSWALLLAGRPQETIAGCRRALVLQPNAAQAAGLEAVAYAQSGELEEAARLARSVPADSSGAVWFRVVALALAGKEDEAMAPLGAFREIRAFATVAVLATSGRADEAFAQLEIDRLTATRIDWLLFHPVFDNLRRDPRFGKLLARLGLTEAHTRAQAWRSGHPGATAKVAQAVASGRSHP